MLETIVAKPFILRQTLNNIKHFSFQYHFQAYSLKPRAHLIFLTLRENKGSVNETQAKTMHERLFWLKEFFVDEEKTQLRMQSTIAGSIFDKYVLQLLCTLRVCLGTCGAVEM